MRLCVLFLIITAACDPVYRYRVVARNAAQAGEPVAHARLGVSCDGAPFAAQSITEADGTASIGGLGGGLPSSCRLEVRHRTFLPQSVEVAKVCKAGSNGQCRSAEWTASLTPAADFEQPVPGEAPIARCQHVGEKVWLGDFAGIGTLSWQPCTASGLLVVESDVHAGPDPVLGAVPVDIVDDVEARDRFLSLDSTWVAAVLHQGRIPNGAGTETLLVLRLEDTGSISIAYQGEPKPKGSLEFHFEDSQGEPELRVRSRDGVSVSLKANASGELEPSANPIAGKD
jgi:hypothetical protein